LWISILEEVACQPLWVIVVRHPAENIRSLEKRNEFSVEKSELLWLQYAREAERATRGRDRILITFDQLMEDHQATLGRIERAAGMPWPIPLEQAQDQIRRFIDPGKRHHRAPDTAGLSWWTRDAYRGLAAAASGDEAALPALMDPVDHAMDAAVSLFGPVIRNRGSEVEKQMAEVSTNYGNLFDSFRDLQARYRETKDKLTTKSAELKTKKEKLRRLEDSSFGRLARFFSRFRHEPKAAEPDAVAFPHPGEPIEVSIIVSASSDLAKTAACLRAIRGQAGAHSFEVLVVAGDAVASSLRRWQNVGVQAIGDARTFGESHNRAAQRARGQYLVFLQDDMIAQPGWIDALIEPLRSQPEIGIVGTEPGVITADGAFEPLAESDSPREADYCTAACLAIARNLFFQVGGFDGFYLPVEEASFGLKVRQTGRRIVRQSQGQPARRTPRRPADPARLESNRRRFMRRWAETLANRKS
ncbi:MAG TPA: glycosyltransferase, partial [Chthoniobacteraceae bacterium]|nr:glycosyltransferase [Chthoniobacteraceae bacterium]